MTKYDAEKAIYDNKTAILVADIVAIALVIAGVVYVVRLGDAT